MMIRMIRSKCTAVCIVSSETSRRATILDVIGRSRWNGFHCRVILANVFLRDH